MKIIKGIFIKIYRIFLVLILAIFSGNKKKKILPIRSHLLKLPAVDLAEKIRKKEITSEELLNLFIERLREVNDIINAVIDERFEDALNEARKADKMVQGMSLLYLSNNYPFLGVPFTVQEALGVKGLPQSVGNLKRKNIKAEKDADVVRLLRDAGAISIAITNNSKNFSLICENALNGKTLNPYDLTRVAGGPNGGESALIASGGSVVGLGADVSGSLRISGLFNGIFAHKPTQDAINIEGLFINKSDECHRKYLTIGPIARYSKDLKPLLHILSEKNQKLRLDQPVSPKNIKIFYKYKINGFFNSLSEIGVDSSMKSSISKALDYFKTCGNAVSELKTDFSKIHSIISSIELIEKFMDDKDEMGKTELRKFDFIGKMRLRNLKKLTDEFLLIKTSFLKALGEDGVFFFPTFPKAAIRPSEVSTLSSGLAYTQIFNYLGFPVTNVPIGLNKAGLPVGFQIVAAPYQDRLCLAVAYELDQVFGGWTPPY